MGCSVQANMFETPWSKLNISHGWNEYLKEVLASLQYILVLTEQVFNLFQDLWNRIII